MIMFIFEDAYTVSSNYHDGGSIAVVAEDRDAAQAIIEEEPDLEVTEDDWENVVEYQLDDNFYYEPRVFAFPDAGCC